MKSSRSGPRLAVGATMLCAGSVTAQFVAGKAVRDAIYSGQPGRDIAAANRHRDLRGFNCARVRECEHVEARLARGIRAIDLCGKGVRSVRLQSDFDIYSSRYCGTEEGSRGFGAPTCSPLIVWYS